MKPIIKTSLASAGATALYIILVGSFLFYGGHYLGNKGPNALVPIFMLMLLVFSAALVGALIFGKPILWYLDGRKKEAITLLGYTLAIFFLILLAAFGTLLYFNR